MVMMATVSTFDCFFFQHHSNESLIRITGHKSPSLVNIAYERHCCTSKPATMSFLYATKIHLNFTSISLYACLPGFNWI